MRALKWQLGGLMVALVLECPAVANGAQPAQPRTLPVAVPQAKDASSPCPEITEQLLTLTDARQMALARQPAVAAAHSALAAAQARYKSIAHLRGLAILARDYHIRKEQSCLGVQAAEAGLTQAQGDAVYSATRMYLSVLYARTQIALAGEIEENLKKMQNAADIQAKKFEDLHRLKIEGYLDVLVERREEAVQGEKRALAALREALGAMDDCHLQVAPGVLPELPPPPCCGDLVALALARRGEMAQANLFAELSDKEIAAQKKHWSPSVRTFASGGDIHSKQVPEANFGAEYSPGAVPPEMPVFMVGWRKGRVDQAVALQARATAVAEKARDLIVLETEEHYLRMEENLKKIQTLKKSYPDLKAKLDAEMDKMDKDKKFSPDYLLSAGELTTRLHLDLNTAQYQYLLELAALERATAGGYCPGFENFVPAKP